jgi:hypothetical protein
MKKCLILLIVLSVLLLTGCASNPLSSYKSISDQQIATINADQAPSAMKAEETSDMLYNMQYGLLLRMNQQYPDSNIYFGRAQEVMSLWAESWLDTTGGKASLEARSLLLNDNSNAYQPRGYERSFTAMYYALNFIDLNNFADARVEIKKMYELEEATKNYNNALYNKYEIESEKDRKDRTSNYLYEQIMKNYDFTDINSPRVLALKNSYQNALGQYLAGFVFEALNEPSLSRPGYLNAGKLNPTNTLIQQSINNLDNGVRPQANSTDLLIVEEVGHAPQIQSVEAHVAIDLNFVGTNRDCINVVNIFYPKLILDNSNLPLYSYQLDTRNMTPLPMVDVNLMAARALHDETPHIISRNIAAAIRNIATAQASCAVSDPTLGAILNIGTALGGVLLDTADERILTLLPSKININRINLPYGKHTITLQVNGQTHTQEIMLNQPYQILAFRIFGDQVFFNTQQSMVNK